MRRVLVSLLAAVFLAGAGYTAYWFYMAAQLRAGLGPWAAARRAEGYDVHWDRAAVGGFPGAFRLRLDGASFGAREPIPYELRGTTILLDAAPWDLDHWRVGAPRGGRLVLAGQAAALAAASAGGTVTLDAPDGTALDLAAGDLAGEDAARGLHIDRATVRLTLPRRPPASHRDTALGADLDLWRVTLPQAVPPFGGTIEAVALAGVFKGGLPPGPLAQSLARWRDEGGTVELKDARLRWGALDINANGTLALDGQLQPEGALTAHFRNQDAVVDAAVAAGGLRGQEAGLVKIILGLMAKPGPDGQTQITVPVNVQDERVYIGPSQIATLPRIAWR